MFTTVEQEEVVKDSGVENKRQISGPGNMTRQG